MFRVSSEPSILDQLEQLGRLKEAGVLSEEEFLEQKKKLMEKL
ncbi:SHOCT domain-containing protein [Chryseobacterium sp. 7]